VISESIAIPPHLSLPPFDARRSIYPTAADELVAANTWAATPIHMETNDGDTDDRNTDAHDRDT
jgi:hypothetical protein